MTNVYEVSANKLINLVAKDLKENKKLEAPEFTYYVKTGPSKERAPDNVDWWYVRIASILRKIYISNRVTVNSLRTYYGSKKNRGVRPSKFKRAGGKVIRVCLQELEKLGFIKIDKDRKGRILTNQGQKYLDTLSSQLEKQERNEKTEKDSKVKEKIVSGKKPKTENKQEKTTTKKTEKKASENTKQKKSNQ